MLGWSLFSVMTPLWMGCETAPTLAEQALAVCEMMPGIHVDAAGRTLAEELLVEDDLRLLDQRSPTAGALEIGAAAYGVIRANSDCELVSAEASGEQGRAVVKRQEPRPDPWNFVVDEVQDLERVEQTLTLDLTGGEGAWLGSLGLEQHHADYDAALGLLEQGDERGAEAALTALHERLPDPMILWDVAQARARAELRESLQVTLEEEGLKLRLTHQGPGLLSGQLRLQQGERSAKLELSEVTPGVEFTLELPEAFLVSEELESSLEGLQLTPLP